MITVYVIVALYQNNVLASLSLCSALPYAINQTINPLTSQ